MSITFRRHYKLFIFFLVTVGVCFAFGSTRIIAYNFGERNDMEIKGKNYDNEIYLYDDSVVHEIKIGLSLDDYEEMVKTYQETGEKEYFRTYVTIDGITIPDVGVRLKGNLTLRQTLGGNGNGQQGRGMPPRNEGKNNGNGFPQPPEGFDRPESMRGMKNMRLPQELEFPENWEDMTEEEKKEQMAKNGNGFNPMMEGNGGNPPYLIKIDEFIAGQTYQNFAEIAVRLGSDKSLLGEPIAYSIHENFGQIVPETAYAIVEASGNEPSLYVICEHLDENYTDKHFPDTKGILYKAGNFVGFEYKGEDPALYAETFEQKTKVNDDDLAPLIQFMKFVSESTDKEFENELPNRLDMDSFITMMALDNLLSNNDSFVGMGSNYYLFYDKNNKKFTMLSWDMNLAMGGMGGGGMMPNGNNQEMSEKEQKRREIFEEWINEGGFNEEGRSAQNQDEQRKEGGMGGHHGTNVLKNRFMSNETFLKMYNTRYEELKKAIFGQNWILEKVDQLSGLFSEYNVNYAIMEQSDYDYGVERIKNFLKSKSE